MISLKSFGAGIAAAVAAAQGVSAEVAKVYAMAVDAMDGAESAYETAVNAGGTKLAGVLAGAEVVAADVGADWPTIKSDVTSLVALVKSTYNSALAATSSSSTTATTASSTAAAAATPTAVAPAADSSTETPAS